MAGDEIPAVDIYRNLVQDLLDWAAEVKTDGGIEPPLTEADLGDAAQRIQQSKEKALKDQNQQAHYAVVETAFREKFYDLLATTSIDDPSFIQIWNLLDVVSIFSDNEQCEPGLIFWLIEELLDSQTIDGCRKVFDYLESRRERNTAKHFKQKNLIILRSCNELLRRLSRAEDTVFCGRVFIYLFQSFPLGDKSSVNLRGEYHTENVTAFDELPKPQESEDSAVDVDMKEAESGSTAEGEQQPDQPKKEPSGVEPSKEKNQTPKPEQQKKGEKESVPLLSIDALYPIFWSLQANFSSPTRLFDPQHFASFKSGLQDTLATFQRLSTDLEIHVMSKGNDESRRGLKRSRGGDGSETTNSFNPKYLTSRDLFELEINDIAFRRHILVQALILLDFVLSLTAKAKTKLVDSTNKSVLYNFTLSDEDAKWAAQTKASIASYLQQGTEGKFYYRMVDTVLTRDKNWVRWKAEACPPIGRDPVSIQDYLDTQTSAVKVSTNKRLRSAPLGSLDLTFLEEDANTSGMDRLKAPERFQNPAIDSYIRGIADDEFNLDMAQSQEEKDEASKSKDSKTWRTLRIASRSKLNLLDKIEDGKNLKVLFESPPAPEDAPKTQPEVLNGTSSSEVPTKDAKDELSKENLAMPDETVAEG